MPYKFNPLTGLFDLVGNDLHIDQTTPQTVINGAPQFNGGTTDAIVIKAGKRLVFDGA